MTVRQLCAEARALLFDLDGTLVDSMPAHNAAWKSVLGIHGCAITDIVLQEYAGVPNERTVELFNERFGWNLVPKDIAAAKEQTVLGLLGQVRPISSVLEMVQTNFGRIPLAVVSGGSRSLVSEILAATKIASYFTTVVAFEDAPRGKPHPDPFLEASRRLAVPASSCLVFEDGDAGIQAARTAKMRVIRVLPDGSLEH